MNAIAAHLEKLKDYIFILLVTGLYTVVANTFGYNGDLAQGAVGILVTVAIAFFGVVIQMLPGFNKRPVVFWVSLTAVIVSIPSFPGGVWIVEQTKHINFLATTTRSSPTAACAWARTSRPSSDSPGASSPSPWPLPRAASSAPPRSPS